MTSIANLTEEIAASLNGLEDKKRALTPFIDKTRIIPSKYAQPMQGRKKEEWEALFIDRDEQVPLSRLAQKVMPSEPNVERLLEFLGRCDERGRHVPLSRAVWLVRRTIWNHCASKGSAGKMIGSNPGRTVHNEFIGKLTEELKKKLVSNWSKFKSGKASVWSHDGGILCPSEIAEAMSSFMVRLARVLYDEGLLDRSQWLLWLADPGPTADPFLFAQLALQYADAFAASKRAASSLISWFDKVIQAFSDLTILSDTLAELRRSIALESSVFEAGPEPPELLRDVRKALDGFDHSDSIEISLGSVLSLTFRRYTGYLRAVIAAVCEWVIDRRGDHCPILAAALFRAYQSENDNCERGLEFLSMVSCAAVKDLGDNPRRLKRLAWVCTECLRLKVFTHDIISRELICLGAPAPSALLTLYALVSLPAVTCRNTRTVLLYGPGRRGASAAAEVMATSGVRKVGAAVVAFLNSNIKADLEASDAPLLDVNSLLESLGEGSMSSVGDSVVPGELHDICSYLATLDQYASGCIVAWLLDGYEVTRGSKHTWSLVQIFEATGNIGAIAELIWAVQEQLKRDDETVEALIVALVKRNPLPSALFRHDGALEKVIKKQIVSEKKLIPRGMTPLLNEVIEQWHGKIAAASQDRGVAKVIAEVGAALSTAKPSFTSPTACTNFLIELLVATSTLPQAGADEVLAFAGPLVTSGLNEKYLYNEVKAQKLSSASVTVLRYLITKAVKEVSYDTVAADEVIRIIRSVSQGMCEGRFGWLQLQLLLDTTCTTNQEMLDQIATAVAVEILDWVTIECSGIDKGHRYSRQARLGLLCDLLRELSGDVGGVVKNTVVKKLISAFVDVSTVGSSEWWTRAASKAFDAIGKEAHVVLVLFVPRIIAACLESIPHSSIIDEVSTSLSTDIKTFVEHGLVTTTLEEMHGKVALAFELKLKVLGVVIGITASRWGPQVASQRWARLVIRALAVVERIGFTLWPASSDLTIIDFLVKQLRIMDGVDLTTESELMVISTALRERCLNAVGPLRPGGPTGRIDVIRGDSEQDSIWIEPHELEGGVTLGMFEAKRARLG